jgi:hypothetical protein
VKEGGSGGDDNLHGSDDMWSVKDASVVESDDMWTGDEGSPGSSPSRSLLLLLL